MIETGRRHQDPAEVSSGMKPVDVKPAIVALPPSNRLPDARKSPTAHSNRNTANNVDHDIRKTAT